MRNSIRCPSFPLFVLAALAACLPSAAVLAAEVPAIERVEPDEREDGVYVIRGRGFGTSVEQLRVRQGPRLLEAREITSVQDDRIRVRGELQEGTLLRVYRPRPRNAPFLASEPYRYGGFESEGSHGKTQTRAAPRLQRAAGETPTDAMAKAKLPRREKTRLPSPEDARQRTRVENPHQQVVIGPDGERVLIGGSPGIDVPGAGIAGGSSDPDPEPVSDADADGCPEGGNDLECSGNGSCGSDGDCDCDPDYEGDACETVCQRCYGAIGNNCGFQDGWDIAGSNFGFCLGSSCWINAGSWRHDECCIEHRQNGPSSNQGNCSGPVPEVCANAFSMAEEHMALKLTWQRNDIDTSKKTCTTGTADVSFGDMCAPSGSELLCSHADDYCCSGSGQPPFPGDPFVDRCICD